MDAHSLNLDQRTRSCVYSDEDTDEDEADPVELPRLKSLSEAFWRYL